jgi:hypothetical protein
MDMMQRLNEMSEEVEIKSADTVLRQVSNNIKTTDSGNKSDLSSGEILDVLDKISDMKKKK